MLTRPERWRRVELRLQRTRRSSYRQRRRLFNSLCREARLLRAVPGRNPLDGLEVDLRLAAALRALPRAHD